MALGRQVAPFEARSCFSCHTTAMTSATPLNVASLVPGVTCEACHGPGAAHVAAMQTKHTGGDLHIFNPGTLSPAQSVDFCGACHSSPWDVRLMGAVGLQTVRFPAYRLEKSRCWGAAGDERVTCISCHDPHQPLVREASAYDSACLACHQTSVHAKADADYPGAACPVAKKNCTSCHMPKYELPEMHYKFTDHMIRIARKDAPFPD